MSEMVFSLKFQTTYQRTTENTATFSTSEWRRSSEKAITEENTITKHIPEEKIHISTKSIYECKSNVTETLWVLCPQPIDTLPSRRFWTGFFIVNNVSDSGILLERERKEEKNGKKEKREKREKRKKGEKEVNKCIPQYGSQF